MTQPYVAHNFGPKHEVIKRIKENCTAEQSVNELFLAFKQMAAAVGVEITCSIVSSNPDHEIDRLMFAQGMQHCSAAIGVLAAGAKFNPKHLIHQHAHESKNANSVQPGINLGQPPQ